MNEIKHKDLVKRTLPIAADMVLLPLMWLVEIYLISYISIAAIGIFGLIAQIIILISTFFFTLNTGSSILILKSKEDNDPEYANHIFSHTIAITFYFSLIIGILFYFSIPSIEKLVLKTDVSSVNDFLKIVAITIPVMSFNFIYTGLIRSCGEGNKSFGINLIISVINLGALLFYFHNKELFIKNGITIAGFCLLFSNIVGFILITFLSVIDFFNLKLKIIDFIKLRPEIIKKIFKRSFYIGSEQLLWASGQTYLTFLAGIFSPVILASHNIVRSIQSFITMIYQGIGINFFVHYNDAIDKSKLLKKVLLHTFMVVILITLIIIIFHNSVITFFSNFNEKYYKKIDSVKYIQYIKEGLFVMLSSQFFKALNIIASYGLKKRDKLKWLTQVTLISTVLFVLIGGFLGTKFFHNKIVVIWIIIGIDEIFKSIMNFYKLKLNA